MPSSGRLIPRSFYQRSVVDVAKDLLGMHLRRDEVLLRITEVEAYDGPEDTASHCRFGRTPRNAPMWQAGGIVYIYFCYGVHHMLNIVTGPEDQGSAVLIRSCEPLEGLELIQRRRDGKSKGPDLLSGPGKVAQALDLDMSFNSHPLYESGGLELREGTPPESTLRGPRVGVPYAHPDHQSAPLRFAAGDSHWVSHRKTLTL
jgi:DNA-3-methyladenine glycosylase